MIKKRYGVPALILGLTMLGGSSAYAFGPGGFDLAAFSSFSSEEQAAIQEANEIRQSAEEEAQAVLNAAGITKDELRDAVRSHGKQQHTALAEALDSNDYDAYKALIADSPKADQLTEDVFAKLVEIRELEQDGDREGAMELRKELKDLGFMSHGFGGKGHGSKGPRPADDTAE